MPRPLSRVDLVRGGTHPSTVRFVEALAAALPAFDVAPRQVTTGPSALSRVPGLARPDDYLRRWLRNPITARRASGEVIHLVDDNGPIARWSPPARTIVTRHDMIPLLALHGEIPYSGPKWYLRRFEHGVRSLARVAAVVCPTETVRTDVLRFCPVNPERVHVIHHGVGAEFTVTDTARQAAVRASLPGGDRPLILHVGTGGFYKNAGAPMEVIRRLAERGVDCALVRVGSPPPGEPSVPSALAPRLIDLGRVSNARLIELYGAVDAFLFPSLAEGFGFPVLEAMACGTPVIASDIPALREVGGEAPMFAPPQRLDQMADAVEAVLGDSALRAKLTAAGLRRAGELDWGRTAREYARLYRSVTDA